MVQIPARPKVTLSQMSRLFIGILYIAAVVIVRTINSRTKKSHGYVTVFPFQALLPRAADGKEQNIVTLEEPISFIPRLYMYMSSLGTQIDVSFQAWNV